MLIISHKNFYHEILWNKILTSSTLAGYLLEIKESLLTQKTSKLKLLWELFNFLVNTHHVLTLPNAYQSNFFIYIYYFNSYNIFILCVLIKSKTKCCRKFYRQTLKLNETIKVVLVSLLSILISTLLWKPPPLKNTLTRFALADEKNIHIALCPLLDRV